MLDLVRNPKGQCSRITAKFIVVLPGTSAGLSRDRCFENFVLWHKMIRHLNQVTVY